MHIFSRMTGAVSSFFIIFSLMFSPILNAIPLMQVPTAHAAEFVSDGDFASGGTGAGAAWTEVGSASYNSVPSFAPIGYSSMPIMTVGSSASNSSGSFNQTTATPLIAGHQYNVSFDIILSDNTTVPSGYNAQMTISENQTQYNAGFYMYNSGMTYALGTKSGTFTASATGPAYVNFDVITTGSGHLSIDNVSITDVPFTNHNPVFTSSNAVSIPENTTAVTTVVATDADAGQTVSYSLDSTTLDGDKFSIDSATGVLTFNTAPDFENPTDVADTAGNNTYQVKVTATDDYSTPGADTQVITVTVTDVALAMTSALTADVGGATGQIDAISVNFNMDLNGASVTAADFNVAGYAVTSASETSAGVVDLTLTESGATDTDATPQVSIVGSITSTPSTGSEAITSGNITPADGVKPVVTEVTPVPTPGNIMNPAYTFSSSEAGSFTLGGCSSLSPTTVVAGNNTISFTAAPGTYNCTIAVVDAGGNAADVLNATEFVVDTTAPGIPTVDTLTTNDTTPALTGTLPAPTDASDTVSVVVNGNVYSGTNNADGTWTLADNTISPALTAGTYDVAVNVSDTAGNTASDIGSNELTIDLTPPTTPTTAPDLKASSDLGDSNNDDITNSASGMITFTVGACTPGYKVQMYITGAISVGSPASCAGASMDVTVPVGSNLNGDYYYTYKVIDAAGNESGSSPQLTVHFDSTVPSDSPATSITTDTGVSNSDGVTNDNTLMFNGTIGTDTTHVEVFLDGSSIGNAILNTGASIWALDHSGTPLADGSYVITTKSTDVAGNVSGFSTPFNLTVDTGVPTVTSIGRDTNPIFTGDLTQQVSVTFNSTMDTSVTPVITTTSTHFTQGTGVWSMGDKTYTVTLTHDGTPEEIAADVITLASGAKDLAGNVDTAGFSLTALPFVVDTQAPPVPGTPVLLTSDDTNINTDHITYISTPTLTGTCTGTDTVNIYLNGSSTPAGSAACGGSTYSVPISSVLADGIYAVTAKAVDSVGNVSGVSGTFSPLVIDTQNPAVTVEQATSQNDPTNTSPVVFTIIFDESIDTSSFVVGDITIGGTATVGTSTVVEVAPNDGTTFTLSVPVTADGTVTADIAANKVIDIAGNSNTASVSTDNQVTVDTTAPSAPVISTPAAGANVTGKPVVSGTAEAGSVVTVSEGSTTLCTDTADSAGNWSCVATSPLVEGAHNFTAVAVDAVGNTSPASAATNVTVVGFSITPNTLVVAENAGTATFDVVLDIQPISTVVITATSTATGEAVASPTVLTFTNANWNTPQTVTVTGVDDTAYTTDSAAIVVSVDDAASDDAFDAISNQIVAVSLTNDDTAPSGGGGGGGGYRHVCKDPEALNYQPFGYSVPSMCEYDQTEGQVLGVATHQFISDLTLGSTGDEVTALQNRLTEEGVYTGPITGYFGYLTQAAVIRYQKEHGIVPAAGYFGPITREEMNAQDTSGSTDPQTPEDDTIGLQAQIDRLRAILEELMELVKQRSA